MMEPFDATAIAETVAGLTHTQWHMVSEAATRTIYSKFVAPGDVVIDCGANCGEHAHSLAALVGPAGVVHAFEPNSAHYPALQAIGPNLRLRPFAVGDALAVRTLHVPQGLDGWASLSDIRGLLADRRFTLRSTVQVPIDALDELAGAPVRFIKIDVESNELPALRGMRRLLEEAQPVLILENIGPEIVALLEDAGYSAHDLTGTPLKDGKALLSNAAAFPRGFDAVRIGALLLSAEESDRLIQAALRPPGPSEAESLAAAQERIRELEADAARLSADSARLAAESERLTARAAELEGRFNATDAELRRTTASLSWRVTQPLRRVRSLLR